MMGGIMNQEQANQFRAVMEWDIYEEDQSVPDEIRLAQLDAGVRMAADENRDGEVTSFGVYGLNVISKFYDANESFGFH